LADKEAAKAAPGAQASGGSAPTQKDLAKQLAAEQKRSKQLQAQLASARPRDSAGAPLADADSGSGKARLADLRKAKHQLDKVGLPTDQVEAQIAATLASMVPATISQCTAQVTRLEKQVERATQVESKAREELDAAAANTAKLADELLAAKETLRKAVEAAAISEGLVGGSPEASTEGAQPKLPLKKLLEGSLDDFEIDMQGCFESPFAHDEAELAEIETRRQAVKGVVVAAAKEAFAAAAAKCQSQRQEHAAMLARLEGSKRRCVGGSTNDRRASSVPPTPSPGVQPAEGSPAAEGGAGHGKATSSSSPSKAVQGALEQAQERKAAAEAKAAGK